MIAAIIFNAILVTTTIAIAVYVYLDGINNGDWPALTRRQRPRRKP